MKFKYKKIILIITMCTMCIGMVTISLSTPSKDKETKEKAYQEQENTLTQMSDGDALIEDAGVSETSDVEQSVSEEIDSLVQTYLNLSLICDMDELAKIVTNTEFIKEEELRNKQQMIESYQNIECYTVNGLQAGEYLVYVYSEVKFTGIDTPAPGLTRLYVVTDQDSTLRVETGVLSQKVQDMIGETDKSEEVQKIIQTVNYKLEEAINKDEQLRTFYSNINGGSDTVDTEDEQEPTPTTQGATPTDVPMEQTNIINE